MHSIWYGILQALGAELQAVATANACSLQANPALPLDLRHITGGKALVYLHRGDRLLDKPGQSPEKRRGRVLVGAAAVTADAMADADRLHFAARLRLRQPAFRTALRAVGAVGTVNEVELEQDLREISVVGHLLISAFEIEYFQPYPAG